MKHCTLVLFNGASFGIRVKNFPVLPIGSEIDLRLDEHVIEGLKIESYTASNKYGIGVHMVPVDPDSSKPGIPSSAELEEIFNPSKKREIADYMYPDVVEF